MDPFDQFNGINLFGNQPNPVNPYNSNPLLIPPPGQPVPGGGPRIPPFTPAEEESILSRIGSGALRGLGYVGSSLGKAFGGRAIRGALGGHLDELASVIPFSDTLGITDPEREVRGSDLLGGDKDTPFLSAQGLGGLALDVALDPATYLTFGGSALTQAGQAAKRAGSLADSLTGRMLAGQQGLVGLGLPFAHPSTVLGAGQGGVDVLNAAGNLASKVPGATGLYNNVLEPAGRYWNYLFDPTVSTGSGSAISAEGQAAARAANKQRALADVASRQIAQKAGQALGANVNNPQALTELRRYMELGTQGLTPGPWRPGVQQAGDVLAGGNEQLLKRLNAFGLGNELIDPAGIGYAARQQTPLAKETAGYGGKTQMLPTKDIRLSAREDILKGLPRGTEALNELTGNQALYDALQKANNPLEAAAQIREQHLGWTPETLQAAAPSDDPLALILRGAGGPQALEALKARLPADEFEAIMQRVAPSAPESTLQEMHRLRQQMNEGTITARTQPDLDTLLAPGENFISYPTAEGQRLAELERQYKQSLGLADLVKGLDPQIVKRGGMFLNSPIEDFAQHAAAVNRVTGGANATMNMLAKGVASTLEEGAKTGKTVPLMEVLDRVFGEGGQATAAAKQQMISRLSSMSGEADIAFGAGPEALLKMQVPESIAADAGKFLKSYTTPEGLEPFLKIWDSATNLTKAGQTSLWPAFHARNAVTGLWQNFVTNAFDPRYGTLNPMRYLRPFIDAWKLRSPGALLEDAEKIPLFKGLKLTNEEATQKVMELASAHGVLNQGNAFSEVIGGEGLAKTMRLPGEGAQPLLGAEGKLKGATWNPLDIAGVGGIAGVGKSNQTRFLPGVVGQHIGESVDQTNRLSAFIAKLRQGFEPGAASAEAKLAHFDYSALTPFERSTMRRVIPFYNWMSNNIPFTVRQLAEQPGGKLGAALKTAGEAQGRTGGYLPDQVASGLALPLGEDKEAGTKTFLSHTGLPFEDVADYLSGTDYLRNLNPLIKAPVELATGHQFESGRRLADLYQFPTGNTVVNELLANSPVGRAVSTFRTAIDERKSPAERALNMLSGVHETTVDMNQARTIAARNYLEDALSGNPHFRASTDLSVRPDALADLSPQEVALLRLKATLDKAARDQATTQRRAGVRVPA